MRFRDHRITIASDSHEVLDVPKGIDPNVMATPREIWQRKRREVKLNRVQRRRNGCKKPERLDGLALKEKPWSLPKQPQVYNVDDDGKIHGSV